MEQEWNPKQKKSVMKLRVYTKNYQKAVGCKKELILMKWLIENHFDYNGLIQKGLAIYATGLNIY